MRLTKYPILLGSLVTLFTSNVSAHSKARDPIRYISALEDLVINTQSGRVDHLSHFELTFQLHNKQQRVKLDLRPNHDILAENAHVEYLDKGGKVKYSEAIDRRDHKVFKGSAWRERGAGHWDEVGWARIYLKQDGLQPMMEGAFSIMGDHHTIQQRSSYARIRRSIDVNAGNGKGDSMIVYRDSDMAERQPAGFKRDSSGSLTCGADNLTFNSDQTHSLFGTRSMDSKRQSGSSGNIGAATLRGSIGDTTGCPTELRVALIGVATDCGYTASFTSVEALRQNVINVVNSASDVYERTFNITIGLRNLTVSDAECPSTAPQSAQWNLPCSNTADISDRLDLFSRWRGGLDNDNAYWSLFSTCPTASAVGLAWLGQLCVSGISGFGSQAATGANFVARTASEWQVFAHESGHTFGAVHDCDATACSGSGADECCPISTSGCDADGQYIMSPVSSASLTDFSPCTIGNICSNLGRDRISATCLTPNRNLTTITGGQCGNGIVEAGEDCDGDNACCDPATCKFRDSAVCDDANDACCSSCQFTPTGTVCRASNGICDVEETCSGTSSTCPADENLPNGQSCGNSTGLVCASGQCTSRDLQCQTVINPFTNANYSGACDSSSCSLTCSSGASSTQNFCASMNQNLLDGTPCTGGSCRNGICRSTSNNGGNNGNDDNGSNGGGRNGDGDSVSSWFDRNRNLVIGLAAGLGSLVVIILGCCIISCCRKRKKRQIVMPPPPMPMTHPYRGGPPGYPGGTPGYPVPAHPNYNSRQNSIPMVRYA